MHYEHLLSPLRQSLLAVFWFAALLVNAPLAAQTLRFADPDPATVVDLIDQRLSLMPEVAAWKWRAQQPIADSERERQVLDRSVAEAEAIGLEGISARRFFDVQIRIARAVQARHFDTWQTQGAGSAPLARDLNAELRPLLDSIGSDLLKAIYLSSATLPLALQNERVIAGLERLRRHQGVADALWSELRTALSQLRIATATNLQIIRRVGVLRVGTTGDYAPFSIDRDGALTGFDIRLAMALAQHMGVSIKFIRTTWPTLMDDFKRHNFDIAMSGISITAERQTLAGFSSAYHIDGKTPIARCADAAKFSALDRIDKQGVRLIVNPGGTNERFVREHIRQAAILLHADNRTIFEEIVAGRADVMITDGIEVTLQTRRHPALCGTIGATLTVAPKAIMLPQNAEFIAAINAWLAPLVKSDQLRRQLQQAVNETD